MSESSQKRNSKIERGMIDALIGLRFYTYQEQKQIVRNLHFQFNSNKKGVDNG